MKIDLKLYLLTKKPESLTCSIKKCWSSVHFKVLTPIKLSCTLLDNRFEYGNLFIHVMLVASIKNIHTLKILE